MGCGKSSVGRRIAANTGRRFVDTDELVASKAGQSISRIFAAHGEAHFRDLESRTLTSLLDEKDIVLATGGGIILREENRAALRRIGPVIWLDAAPDILFERVSRNRKRPLLQSANPRATFDALIAERLPIYTEAADVRVDSTGLSHDDTARVVVEAAAQFAEDQSRRGFDS